MQGDGGEVLKGHFSETIFPNVTTIRDLCKTNQKDPIFGEKNILLTP